MLPCYHIPIPMFSCYHCNSKQFSRGSHLKKKPLDQAAILSPLPSFLPTPPSQNCQVAPRGLFVSNLFSYNIMI